MFKKPVELVGPFVLHLQAASTAIDTDWIVKLCGGLLSLIGPKP